MRTLLASLFVTTLLVRAPLAQAEAPRPALPPGMENFMSAPEADPKAPFGVTVHAAAAFEGTTLFAPLNAKVVYLIDMDGKVVHSWPTDSSPAGGLYLLEDGSLLRCGREDDEPRFRGGGIGGRIQKLAPDGSPLWNWRLSDEHHQQHHDLEPLPNGNVLVITWERVSASEAVERGRDRGQIGQPGLWPDAILEVKPLPPSGAEIVWEWHAWDHIVQDVDAKLGFGGPGAVALYPGLIDVNGDHRSDPPMTAEELRELKEQERAMAGLGYIGGEEEDEPADEPRTSRFDRDGDWLHTNAVDFNPEYDLIVLSTPRFDELWVIDHSTTSEQAAGSTGGRWGHGGDLLWRWGNPRRYGAGDADDQRLWGQHDPSWIPGAKPGELRLLVFNNGAGREPERWTSVDELILPFDPQHGFRREPRQAFGPAEPVWTYSAPDTFFAAFISGAQRLPNGNTLICSGPAGRLFEVTRAGEVVWDFRNPHGGDVIPPDHAGQAPPLSLFRGTRLAPDHPGVRALLR